MLYSIIHSGLVNGSLYCVLATSFYLIFSTSRIMHFAHGTVAVVGAYLGYDAFSHNWGLVPSFLVATVVGAVVGGVCDSLVYRPLRSRGAPATTLLIASLAIVVIGQNVLAIAYGSQAVALITNLGTPISGTGQLYMSPIELISIGATIGWIAVIYWMLTKTRLGLFTRCVADHEDLSMLTGIPVARVRSYVFLIASAAVGLIAFTQLVDLGDSPTNGINLTLFAIVPFIVGGQGSLTGTVITSYVVAVAAAIFSWFVGSEWSLPFVFGMLGVVVLFRPQGLSPAAVAQTAGVAR
jgi:branched-chain amino acid transport system permease protein